MCVDGQQRLTTTALLVSALADHLASTGLSEARLEQAEHVLFNNQQAVETLRNTPTSSVNEFYPFLRLLPSELDRKPFLVATLGIRNGLVVIGE